MIIAAYECVTLPAGREKRKNMSVMISWNVATVYSKIRNHAVILDCNRAKERFNLLDGIFRIDCKWI